MLGQGFVTKRSLYVWAILDLTSPLGYGSSHRGTSGPTSSFFCAKPSFWTVGRFYLYCIGYGDAFPFSGLLLAGYCTQLVWHIHPMYNWFSPAHSLDQCPGCSSHCSLWKSNTAMGSPMIIVKCIYDVYFKEWTLEISYLGKVYLYGWECHLKNMAIPL